MPLRSLTALTLLALGACISVENDTSPQTIERGTATASTGEPCEPGEYRTYRPSRDRKASPDAVLSPTYDAPSQVPSSCRRLDK